MYLLVCQYVATISKDVICAVVLKAGWLRLIVLIFVVFVVNLPFVRLVYVIHFPLHILEDFILHRCELFIPFEHSLIA